MKQVLGWVLAAAALAMLVLAFCEIFSPLTHTTFGLRLTADGDRARVASVLAGSDAQRAGIRSGDEIVLMAMPLGRRLRLETSSSPAGTAITVPVVRGGVIRLFTIHAQTMASRRLYFTAWPMLLNACISLIIMATIALRKPSIATAALVLYGMGSITTFGVAAQFSWLPEPWYTFAAVYIIAAFSTLPAAALLPFVVRFPNAPETPAGILRMRAADAIFGVVAVLSVLQVVYEPFVFLSWLAIDLWSQLALLLLVLFFAGLVYRDATGEARRRIGWVIAGLAVSSIGYAGFNVVDFLFFTSANNGGGLPVLGAVSQLLGVALPIALAYAVLRHRVLDIGFAVNRTIVYGAMTALVVVVVSLVDWLTSHLLNEQRLALAVEAVVTIGFGLALNWIHARTERLIDRIVFRSRHIAEKRIEYRIGALGFATSSQAVDDALGGEAPRILDLASAAVFARLGDEEPFARKASTGWEEAALQSFDNDALLVRTLRSLERPILLEDVAIRVDGAPHGHARPMLAIPIATQHDLRGFVLYGNRRDGALPDPEEVALLAKLCAAAGHAYGAVEAREWRERATALGVPRLDELSRA